MAAARVSILRNLAENIVAGAGMQLALGDGDRMKYTLNNKEVELGKTEFDGDMVTIMDACFVENDQELTDDELDQLQDKYAGELFEMAMSHAQAKAYDDYKANRRGE